MPAVKVDNLCKTFSVPKKKPGIAGTFRALLSRDHTLVEAVKNISFEIEEGEVVGFLGPNGAGKTTTLKMLSGILFPTSGEAQVLGYRPFDRNPKMLSQISLVMGNRQQLWWDLPAWDSFVVLRELYDVSKADFDKRIEYLLEVLQLEKLIHTQVRKLSLGERMKCELVAALIHSPKVIFLDEPTIGLDVVSQKRIRDFLFELNRTEKNTILLTSHYMQDIQELCRRVIVIDHGTLIYQGTLDSLTEKFSDVKQLRLTFEEEPLPDLSNYGQIVEQSDLSLVLAVPRTATATVISAILNSHSVQDIAIEDVSAEEVIRNLFSIGRAD